MYRLKGSQLANSVIRLPAVNTALFHQSLVSQVNQEWNCSLMGINAQVLVRLPKIMSMFL